MVSVQRGAGNELDHTQQFDLADVEGRIGLPHMPHRFFHSAGSNKMRDNLLRYARSSMGSERVQLCLAGPIAARLKSTSAFLCCHVDSLLPPRAVACFDSRQFIAGSTRYQVRVRMARDISATRNKVLILWQIGYGPAQAE